MREQTHHRLVLILFVPFALVAFSLLFSAFYSTLGVDRAAQLGAFIAFLVTAGVSFAFKSFLEG